MEAGEQDQTTRRSAWIPTVRAIGILAVVSAFLPSFIYRGGDVRTEAEREFLVRNPDAMPFRSDFTLGWQNSPLVRRFSEATLTVDPTSGMNVRRSSGLNVELLSWSMAGLLAGAVILWVTRSRRPHPGNGPL